MNGVLLPITKVVKSTIIHVVVSIVYRCLKLISNVLSVDAYEQKLVKQIEVGS